MRPAARAAAGLVVGLCLTVSSALAQAPLLDEVRLGLLMHSLEPSNNERGADLNLEVLFRRPATVHGNPFLDWAFRPRAHIGASLNLESETSQLYAGFTWDFKLARDLTLELTFGGAVHDGPTHGAADSYGCTVNFRESVSLGYALNERWSIYGTLAHMSNANLCDHNSGLTSAGVRLGYKLQ